MDTRQALRDKEKDKLIKKRNVGIKHNSYNEFYLCTSSGLSRFIDIEPEGDREITLDFHKEWDNIPLGFMVYLNNIEG